MSENVGQIGLAEPFDIDDGSLKGITPEKAFSLGVEWHLFRQRLDSQKAFTIFCLPENATRLVKMVERHTRFVEERPNVAQGWTQIYVGDCFA